MGRPQEERDVDAQDVDEGNGEHCRWANTIEVAEKNVARCEVVADQGSDVACWNTSRTISIPSLLKKVSDLTVVIQTPRNPKLDNPPRHQASNMPPRLKVLTRPRKIAPSNRNGPRKQKRAQYQAAYRSPKKPQKRTHAADQCALMSYSYRRHFGDWLSLAGC